jgi:hypothetical protein
MNGHLPEVITLKSECSTHLGYDNHPIANINDHVVRIATMTEPYHWHFHPNSDETFLVIEDGFPSNSRADRANLILANYLLSLAESAIGPGRLARDQ